MGDQKKAKIGNNSERCERYEYEQITREIKKQRFLHADKPARPNTFFS